jgi:CheY-like chemotaxis protein/anti-sigma regulatory factor (Ser/Thr protein kinase)
MDDAPITIRVLVVEDSENDALLMIDGLTDGGFDVTWERVYATDTVTAALVERDWDIVIADYAMPGFRGSDALQILHDTGLDIPFILVSGTARDETGVEMMLAGASDFILKDNLSRLVPAVRRELNGARVRQERMMAQQREKEQEAQKHEFYKRTIEAATGGKLVISDHEHIEQIAGPEIQSWQLETIEDIPRVRDQMRSLAREFDMEEDRISNFLSSATEAMTNVIKHGGGGTASLHKHDGSLVFVAEDHGAGIDAMAFPDLALTKGYTTAVSLGMGYKLMIEFMDKVDLSTGPEGTTVALEMALHPQRVPVDDLLERHAGW